jgi:CPA1 family monovalent cation:H+ antiporter
VSFLESLLTLLAIAIFLLQVSRRLSVPYPTMLAAAGVLLALVPGAPKIALDPHVALALFIAPALAEAAFDFPLVTARRYWRPLFSLVIVAVLITTSSVAWLGVSFGGLPLYAALALGAIVAPPDAAAATAILRTVQMPRRTVTVLKGESLLNDALALMLFTAAVAFHDRVMSEGELALRLTIAVPGGLLLGIGAGLLIKKLMPHVTGTLGGNLLEFVSTFGVWIIAERLHLSAVLSVVAYGMTVARFASLSTTPRMRIHSFAVWDTVVFLLNVFAFLLMGFQATSIIDGMSPGRLSEAAFFATAVVLVVIVTRMAWLLIYNRLASRFRGLRGGLDPAPLGHGILIGWTGMRGLVTLAAAFALPLDFPKRDLIVLSAFSVVLATLVLQGLTLSTLVRVLGLDGDDGLTEELRNARAEMARAGSDPGTEERYLAERGRQAHLLERRSLDGDGPYTANTDQIGLGRQRLRLESLRDTGVIGADAFLVLQEELDFAEVAASRGAHQRIEEG